MYIYFLIDQTPSTDINPWAAFYLKLPHAINESAKYN